MKQAASQADRSSPARKASRPLPSGMVKAAALSILPWTVGSMLSPFGEPHPVLLAVPLAALVALVAAVRTQAGLRLHVLPWAFTGLLLCASGVRFLVMPFVTELAAGGEDLTGSGQGIERLFLITVAIQIAFYVASAGLLLATGWSLLRSRDTRRSES